MLSRFRLSDDELINENDFDEFILYVIKCGPYFKVGITGNLTTRISILRDMIPFSIKRVLKRTVPKALARRFEQHIHDRLADHCHRGEWFLTDLRTIKLAVASAQNCIPRWIGEYRGLR